MFERVWEGGKERGRDQWRGGEKEGRGREGKRESISTIHNYLYFNYACRP
jgi:hypothetical protein